MEERTSCLSRCDDRIHGLCHGDRLYHLGYHPYHLGRGRGHDLCHGPYQDFRLDEEQMDVEDVWENGGRIHG